MSTGNHTQAERAGKGAAFHGERTHPSQDEGGVLLGRSFPFLGWPSDKSQDATLWPWLLLVPFAETLLSDGWSSQAPVSSRSDSYRVGGSLGFCWCQPASKKAPSSVHVYYASVHLQPLQF